jgi:hypothetical protein
LVELPVRWLLALALAGCAAARPAPLDPPSARDLAPAASADLAAAESADLTAAESADLTAVDASADLAPAAPPDLAPAPDLSRVADLAGARDLTSPPPDPCAFAASGDGAYCGQSLPGGQPGWLYSCVSGMTTNRTHCPNACKQNAPGTPDYCV